MSTEIDTTYDVIIIGGGPAGATAGAILAEAGLNTLILERTRFPRFHIGESLMPETYWTFKRIGMLPKLKASNFPRKYSVQFVTASGKESQPFYFDEMNPHECSVTWQVVRSEFDKMMLDNAAERGAHVVENANVTDVLLEPTPTDSLPRATGVTVQITSQQTTNHKQSPPRSSSTPPAPPPSSPKNSTSKNPIPTSARPPSSPTTKAPIATPTPATKAQPSSSPPRTRMDGSGTSRCRMTSSPSASWATSTG